ncbi:MAG TPA: glycosyltransferase family 2 protein [Ignavibacteria bacterium]|nr:glycosyltransferase family 2 protein [Ignavibacteria bacterium]
MTPSKNQNVFSEKDENQSNDDSKNIPSIDKKISEIEDRIRNLYEKNIPDFMQTPREEVKSDFVLGKKLEDVSSNVKQLSDDIKSTPKTVVQKSTVLQGAQEYSGSTIEEGLDQMSEIETRLEEMRDRASDLQRERDNTGLGTETDHVVKSKLNEIDNQIKEIKNSISSLYTEQRVMPSTTVEERLKSIEEKLTEEKKPAGEKAVPHGPITLRPKEKKEGLFNDANLTEDYELGFRFYQLGFKTGFFNVKLDRDDEASRIATAEFFPNTFWASVKQRSRWVAGIVFQNWKAHKWSGNLSTKYFLFRDRKSIFSFFSAFLSNIVIGYFIFAIISHLLGWQHVNSLVGQSSVLWYLMIANLVFMISRLSHRFVFTYNWYGFKYAFFSIFRLPLDTVINFFAIARSLNVYKNVKSKAKVVWDSTSHY